MFLRRLVPWPSVDIHGKFYEDRPREPSVGGEGKRKRGSQSDFGPIEGYISETVQDRRYVSINLKRLLSHVVDIIMPESHCGFRRGRSTVDMIFVARLLQEKCREQNRDLYLVFIDLTKAFDTVNKDLLWNCLEMAQRHRRFRRTSAAAAVVLITNRKSYMSFRLVSKSVTLNDLERRNVPYFALFYRIR